MTTGFQKLLKELNEPKAEKQKKVKAKVLKFPFPLKKTDVSTPCSEDLTPAMEEAINAGLSIAVAEMKKAFKKEKEALHEGFSRVVAEMEQAFEKEKGAMFGVFEAEKTALKKETEEAMAVIAEGMALLATKSKEAEAVIIAKFEKEVNRRVAEKTFNKGHKVNDLKDLGGLVDTNNNKR